MSDRGYIALARGSLEHEIFAPEPFTEREAWVWLIFEAAWKPRRVRRGDAVIDLARGELAHALEFMRAAWKWKSKSRVARFLKRLEADSMIVRQAVRDATRITICNYDKYQRQQNADDTPTERSRDARGTPAERSRYELEEINHLTIEEGKEGKEVYSSPPATPDPPDPSDDAVAEFNRLAVRTGLPQAQKITKARKRALRARIAEAGGVEGWQAALAKIEASDFLTGRIARTNGHENWTPNLDWFLKPANFTKLLEGSYDNKPGQHQAKSDFGRARAELREFAFGGDR